MSKLFLGIDTSNYRTSAALYDAENGCWKNEGRLLDVPDGAIGLRQSEALFQHTLHLCERIGALPAGTGRELRGIGVSVRPRAVEGSYMPCFLAGESVARSTAHLLGLPLSACSHQQGHLAAAALSAGRLDLLQIPFFAWHLSGGTTELLRVEPGVDGLPAARCIGGTTDLAAGQLVDRAGRLLGLTFPAGAELDRLACEAAQPMRAFSPRVRDCRFSLSGVENQVKRLQQQGASAPQIARFTLDTIGNAVVRATEQALHSETLPVLCAGGVLSSVLLQARMRRAFHASTAQAELSGDNAVGCALLAAVRQEEAR